MSAASGFLITFLGKYRPILWVSFAVYTVGMGLMTMLDAGTSVALQEIYPLIAGIGLGCLFQTPMVALTAAMPPAQMATSVASLALVRTASGTVGITVAGSIFNTGVQSRIKNIPAYLAMIGGDTGSATQSDLRNLIHIQPPELARQVVDAYGDALRLVWIVLTPIVGIGFLSTLGIKAYSLNRRIVRGNKDDKTNDVESQEKKATDEDVGALQEGGDGDKDEGGVVKLKGEEDVEKGPITEREEIKKEEAVFQAPDVTAPSAKAIIEKA